MNPRDRVSFSVHASLALALAATAPCQRPDVESARIAVQRNAGLQAVPGGLHGGGERYDVRFDAAGMRFEPALGASIATTQRLGLSPIAVERGGEPVLALPSGAEPRQHDRTAVFAHSRAVRERFAVGVDGVELSWIFDERPAGHGDLVVRYAVDTELAEPVALPGGGLYFAHPGVGGVTVGTVTGIDAAGRSVPGGLHYENGELSLSLPDEFVDRASYPLVLDPLIGTRFDIWGGPQYTDSQPDCSFEKTEDRFLVTFLRYFSAGDVRIRAQLIDRTAGLFQGVIWVTTGGFSLAPRVASFSSRDRFGVVWTTNVGTQSIAYFRSVSSIDGSTSTTRTLGQSTAGTLRNLDIGSEAGAFQQDYAFVTVWDDTNDGRIYARRVGIDAGGNSVLYPAYTVFADAGLNEYSQPAIARAAATGGKLMVAARRFSGIGPTIGISSRLVSARDNTVSSPTTIAGNTTDEFRTPEVDGYGNEWVVAWRQTPSGSSRHAVVMRSGQLVGSSVQLAPPVTLGGSSLVQADSPTVGYAHGKTWLAYRRVAFGAPTLQARGIDSSTCLSCQDTFSEPVPAGVTRIVVATTMSGNDPNRDEGVIVWAESSDVWVQRVGNHSNGGTVTNIGGGCGAGGNHSAQPPVIGANALSCSVTGLSTTATLTMFNLTIGATPIVCGTCEWLPPSVAVVMPVTQWQNASFGYVFPCMPSLVGVQFETQWTTYDPATTACALYPGFSVSDRLLQTIGQ